MQDGCWVTLAMVKQPTRSSPIGKNFHILAAEVKISWCLKKVSIVSGTLAVNGVVPKLTLKTVSFLGNVANQPTHLKTCGPACGWQA